MTNTNRLFNITTLIYLDSLFVKYISDESFIINNIKFFNYKENKFCYNI